MIVTANIQESHDASSSNVYVAHDEPCHKMNSVEKNLRTLSELRTLNVLDIVFEDSFATIAITSRTYLSELFFFPF